MHDGKDDAHRLAGANNIAARAREIATGLGVHVTACIWDDGREMAGRDDHILEIRTEDKSISGGFSDRQLMDYQGRVGTDHTEATLHEMIMGLL